jgi:hypothetical protein
MLSPVLKFATNKAGFKILAASICTFTPPAPTSVCESIKGVQYHHQMINYFFYNRFLVVLQILSAYFAPQANPYPMKI